MKKSLMFVMLGIISFLGINSVSADTNYNIDTFYRTYATFDDINNNHSNVIENLIDYYNINWASSYDYYYIHCGHMFNTESSCSRLYITPSNINHFIVYDSNGNKGYASDEEDIYSNPSYSYTFSTNEYILENNYSDISWGYIMYSSNTNIHFSSSSGYKRATSITLPSYENSDLGVLYTEINLNDGDVIPTYMSLINGDYINTPNSYVEIDLNKYSYVILSLKDYSPRDTFTSTMYVKGQLCATTLYNYGMEEKKDYVSGYQTQPCSPYYNNLVPFTTYIKSEDINNHAVYYLTSNNKLKPNLVKVDTSVYDITYITSDKKDDPYVSVGGKNYPALSYDSLTDSATLTDKNGISNEWTCAKYDTACLENSSGMNINDLFDKPLEFLKGLWSSITSIFEVITEFLSLLPETMQSFLYLSFMVAIVLGLLKLIL